MAVLLQSYRAVPQHTLDDINNYVRVGQPVGDFLTAVLSNDLFKAVAHADDFNAAALGDIVRYIYNYCPMTCHGSAGIVEAWYAMHANNRKAANGG